jgi:CubicO group peptidase (beta-lactamase class C family)
MQLARRICGFAGVAILSGVAARTSERFDVAHRLDAYVQQQVKIHQFSGTVLVARNGKVLLAKGYGYANVEWQARNSLQTKFRLGSLTKQFTATVIMQLREKRLLDVTDSICKFLEPCPDAWKPATLHHLMSHTSGIPDYPVAQAGASPPRYPWTAEHLAIAFGNTPLEFVPGTRWKYSDTAYSVLGIVIEKVTGKPYEQIVQEQIFTPLGMTGSGYDRTETILAHRAGGYRLAGGKLMNAEPTRMVTPFSAGGLYSTAEDLFRWDQALYTEKVLLRTSLDLMWTDALRGYGYGWMVSRPSATSSRSSPWALPGRFELLHPGSINGFSAEILRFPDDRATVIVLSNVEDMPPLGPALAAIVFGQ